MKENQTPLQELQSKLNELRSRALTIGYKNNIPSLPRATKLSHHGLPPSHLMQGFELRLGNWIAGLEQMEFPGGKPQIVTKPIVPKLEVSNLEQLVQKFENS